MELENVFDDAGETIKKGLKSKPFLIAAAGVAVVALYVAYQRSKTETVSEYESSYGYPTGYSGYPSAGETTDEGFFDYSGDLNNIMDMLDRANETNESLLDSLLQADQTIKEMQETQEKQTADIIRQQTIAAMQTNSSLHNYTTDETLKKSLHEENLSLGESIGLTFDDETGYFRDESGAIAYFPMVSKPADTSGNANTVSGKSYEDGVDYMAEIQKGIRNGASGATLNLLAATRAQKIADMGGAYKVSYDKNTDYAALINKAKAAGANQQVIDQLTEQRNAKIKGENLKV